jgi:hypothetical protein
VGLTLTISSLGIQKIAQHHITGLTPYQMVYGRMGRGPLSILKETWSNDVDIVRCGTPVLLYSSAVNKTALEYFEKLQEHLAVGLDVATTHAAKAEKAYLDYYNLHAKCKQFEVGNLCLILMPTSTNKLLSEWQGPGTITAIVPPNSYRIALDMGAVKTLHANDLRKFTPRVNSFGIVFEDDTDFGKIEYCPVAGNETIEAIDKLDLSYLDVIQQTQLRELLIKY